MGQSYRDTSFLTSWRAIRPSWLLILPFWRHHFKIDVLFLTPFHLFLSHIPASHSFNFSSMVSIAIYLLMGVRASFLKDNICFINWRQINFIGRNTKSEPIISWISFMFYSRSMKNFLFSQVNLCN